MNTGMGPTPGTTRASTLSRLKSSSSAIAMSVGDFFLGSAARALDRRSSDCTSSRPRYPTTGVTAVCRGTSGQSEVKPKISSRSKSASDDAARVSLDAPRSDVCSDVFSSGWDAPAMPSASNAARIALDTLCASRGRTVLAMGAPGNPT